VDIPDENSVAPGEACDSGGDCLSGICASTVFNSDGAKFAFCSDGCTSDAQCGSGEVCTTVFTNNNYCTAKCTKDTECPITGFGNLPASGATWDYLTCNVATGKCTL
jgi:hypothetical protein